MLKHNPIRILGAIALLAGVIAVPLYASDKPKRPQAPSASVPYSQTTVTFANPGGSDHLAGTLTVPPGAGPFPAIVIVPGSGQVNRDDELFGHQFYRVLADDLTRRGFAVLRSDKRGVGESNGSFNAATSADFASDIEAGVAFLRSRKEINPERIGLVGHSENGIIAPMVAGKDPRIVFVVIADAMYRLQLAESWCSVSQYLSLSLQRGIRSSRLVALLGRWPRRRPGRSVVQAGHGSWLQPPLAHFLVAHRS